MCALELEFYLLDEKDARGRSRGGLRPQGDVKPGQVYGLDQLEERQAFLSRLGAYCAAQDLPAKSAVSEYAPDQFEVNLGHVPDPVRAADHAFLLKRAIKRGGPRRRAASPRSWPSRWPGRPRAACTST